MEWRTYQKKAYHCANLIQLVQILTPQNVVSNMGKCIPWYATKVLFWKRPMQAPNKEKSIARLTAKEELSSVVRNGLVIKFNAISVITWMNLMAIGAEAVYKTVMHAFTIIIQGKAQTLMATTTAQNAMTHTLKLNLFMIGHIR